METSWKEQMQETLMGQPGELLGEIRNLRKLESIRNGRKFLVFKEGLH